MQDLLLVFSFISSHIHLIGWSTFIGLIWKLSWKASKFFNDATEALEKINTADKTLTSMATNHLPHLEMEMRNINATLQGLRQDIITVVLSKVN